MRRLCLFALLLTTGTLCAHGQNEPARPHAQLEVLVRDGTSGQALDGARITVRRIATRSDTESVVGSRFAGADGRTFFARLDTGAYTVNVRRLGFAPRDTVVYIRFERTAASIALSMRQVAFTLSEVVVKARSDACTVAGMVRPDLAPQLTEILDATRENAEREITLRLTYPFTYYLVRRSHFVAAHREMHMSAEEDTAFYRSNVVSPYTVGSVVWTDSSTRDANNRPTRIFRLPTLSDLADPAFLDTHCFEVRGKRGKGDNAVVVVAFRPLDSITVSDVKGEIELNARTLLLQTASFTLTRVEPFADVLTAYTVNSSYRLLAPGLAVIDEINAVQKLPIGSTMRMSRFEQMQRLSGLRFIGRRVPGYIARKEDDEGARAMTPVVTRVLNPKPVDTLSALVGTIADDKGKVLLDATVWIGTSLDSARVRAETDSLGRFRLAALPPGTTTVGVRRVGSRPSVFSLTLPRGDSLRVAIRVSSITYVLPEVHVEERADIARLKSLGFMDRQRRYSRFTFRDPDYLKQHPPNQLADILNGTMGVTTGRVGTFGGGTIPMGRGAGGRSCQMALYVDGMFYNTTRQGRGGMVPMPVEDVVNISDVRAVEIYPNGPDVPPEFQAPGLKSACGALVLWTDQSFP